MVRIRSLMTNDYHLRVGHRLRCPGLLPRYRRPRGGEADFPGGLFGGSGALGDGEAGDEEETGADFAVCGGGLAEHAGEVDQAGNRFGGRLGHLVAEGEAAGEGSGGGG